MLFGLNYIFSEIFHMGPGMAKLVATITSFGLLFLSPVNRALMELSRGIWGLIIIAIAVSPFVVVGFIFVSLPNFPAWFVSVLITGAILVLVIVRQLMR